MKPAIVMTVHTKPSHLHSHLLLPLHTQANAAKAKESASNRTCSQQDETVNNVDNSVYIQ